MPYILRNNFVYNYIILYYITLFLNPPPPHSPFSHPHSFSGYIWVQMLLVYGFIEEPRLLIHGGGGGSQAHVRPTALTQQLAKSQPGLLVAGMVALHENNKVQLEQADGVFKVCFHLDFLGLHQQLNTR